jgi:hypothetical protein
MNLFRKRMESAENVKKDAPSKMESAVQHRKEQGRGPLDEWDMFANVMATRNQLPANHPSHLNLQQVTEMTGQEVHRTTNLPLPDAFAVRDESGHAATGGGWADRGGGMSYKPVTLTMKQGYGDKALSEITRNENTDAFRKLVRTTAHEMTHVGQRQDQTFMPTSTTPQREMQAYGGEITHHPSLPALQGKALSSTVGKFNKYASQLGRPMTTEETRLHSSVQTQALTGKGVGK